ncbi:acyl-CoA dehydrogenase domain-containing protein [Beutenbergia cavernae DSM 12333]|uniref:Acyl-CoA dehydrogenase domain-containing protein n=1 Tax=Beutenbergia cavernae (strain ATCC BAA-8 / DSM 12333 / CCUG 43141 / JCM 11478 / NBRC 16432 / NCIMB 13614 / HKI 0122) TaxID=471853 RepID=C5BVP9_BEUC1|nr:hypothetical protein [Beutenbergia cavernae]ACQ78489.1 acyl-CoA dehydrogenase domain-containing protein [Beutenbergia cavernae DSM 12333]
MTEISQRKVNALRVGATARERVGGRSRRHAGDRPPTTPEQRAWLAMCGIAAVFGATVLAWSAVLALPAGWVGTGLGLLLIAVVAAAAIGVVARARRPGRTPARRARVAERPGRKSARVAATVAVASSHSSSRGAREYLDRRA